MTEEEAKTKICCGPPQAAAQLMGELRKGIAAKCAGSFCMAWRWDYDEYGDASEGFCGLAGRP